MKTPTKAPRFNADLVSQFAQYVRHQLEARVPGYTANANTPLAADVETWLAYFLGMGGGELRRVPERAKQAVRVIQEVLAQELKIAGDDVPTKARNRINKPLPF